MYEIKITAETLDALAMKVSLLGASLTKDDDRQETLPWDDVTAVATTIDAIPGVTPGGPGEVETDKNGMPWDARIHAGAKTQNKDGSWRYKRGVDNSIIEAVEAEIRPVTEYEPPVSPPQPAPAAAPQPAPAAAPQPAPDPLAIPAFLNRIEPEVSYEQLIERLTNLVNTGAIDQNFLGDLYSTTNVASAADYKDNPSAINAAWSRLPAGLSA